MAVWASTSSGTFVPWLIVQDRTAHNLQGTTVMLLINAALQTLLHDLDPKQIYISLSFRQTHPNHPRSPACLGLVSAVCLILLNSYAWE